MKNPSSWTMSEVVHIVVSNWAKNYQLTGQGLTNVNRFGDEISVLNVGTSVPAAAYYKAKQFITATNVTNGVAYTVRINCLNSTSTGVTITDTTSNPKNTCGQ